MLCQNFGGIKMYKTITPNLMVESVDETVEFYREKLGFAVADSVPNGQGKLQFAILTKDNLTLMFQERTNLIAEYPILQTAKTQPSITLYFSIDDFDATNQKLKKQIICDTHTTFYGAREFAIKDNNGYVLTFAESK